MVANNSIILERIRKELNVVDFLDVVEMNNTNEYDDIAQMIFIELINKRVTKEQLLKKIIDFVESSYGVSVSSKEFNNCVNNIFEIIKK